MGRFNCGVRVVFVGRTDSRCDQEAVMLWPVAVECAALGVAMAPFAVHRWNMRSWLARPHSTPTEAVSADLRVTVLLPVWNEASVIEGKLENLAEQDLNVHLYLIDSASTDTTVNLARAWLKQNPEAFLSVTVDVMEARKGKSAAVSRALEALPRGEHDLVCMTDADALLLPGTLKRLQKWFADPMIGAVGALPKREHARGEESQHRRMWEAMRIAESSIDSTPFLEGSCMMWRGRLVNERDVVHYANADDAQIATAVRLKGLRVVVDPQALFTDVAPLTRAGQRRQKIRRGQGLQRLLLRKRSTAGHPNMGVFGRVFRRQHHFHVVAPILVGVAVAAGALRWGLVGMFGWPVGSTTAGQIHLAMGLMEAVVMLAWWSSRRGRPLGPLGLLGQWLTSMEWLLRSMLLLAKGQSLHMWEQHAEERLIVKE